MFRWAVCHRGNAPGAAQRARRRSRRTIGRRSEQPRRRAAAPARANRRTPSSAYRAYLLNFFRLPIEDESEKLNADILEIVDGGRFELTATTDPFHKFCLPEMSVRFEGNAVAKPEEGDGAAPYCVWANSDKPNVFIIVVPDVQKNADIISYEAAGAGWYTATFAPRMYKPAKSPNAQYRSIMVAPLMMMKSAGLHPEEEPTYGLLGVISFTHTSPRKFDRAACGWARACATLVASLYGCYYHRAQELSDEPVAPVHAVDREAAPTDGIPVVPSSAPPPSSDPNSDRALLLHTRTVAWKSLREHDYLLEVTTLGDAQEKDILERLERTGVVLIRHEGSGPDRERLESIEQWLGPFRARQNDFKGKVKIIEPKDAIEATTGDSRKDLAPHVDGTQDSTTPAMLLFEYLSTPTYGGASTFTDLVSVLQTFTPDQRHEILEELSHPETATCEKKDLRWKGPLVLPVPGGLALRLRFDSVIKVRRQGQKAFDALKKAVLEHPRTEYKPREGDIVIFDNWRVLHGRRKVGGRHIRLHNRVWLDRIGDKYVGRYNLGVRAVASRTVAAVTDAADRYLAGRVL